MSSAHPTVLIADDHPIYREGLTRAVIQRDDLELVAEAGDGHAALEQIRELRPTVALLDFKMPGLGGLQLLHAIGRDALPTAVVLLSAHTTPEAAYECIAGGAAAFLSKAADRDEICDAVAAAARGEVAADVQGQLVREMRLRAAVRAPRLTVRETEVVTMIADGLSAPEIAERLTLSPSTVRSHLRSLYMKLEVGDRAAAVAAAMRQGLLE
ncbi:MAG: two-component system, NarL family, nitrate/nitrite response regulator NarL [Solirubrobacteraceae bacterium]|nr:two-component system, NarL family, nitrate/nitrite response regulator NarL [Solirubrobacteraceae bacterium]